MTHPILLRARLAEPSGSTGRRAPLLQWNGSRTRALVHKLDAKSDRLLKQGAEVIEGDPLNPASVQAAMRDVNGPDFTYPVADGLLEAATIFADSARNAGLELVVNNSQFQGRPGDPAFRHLQHAPSFRNLQHRWPIASSTGQTWVLFNSRRHPTMRTYALLSGECRPARHRLSAVGEGYDRHSPGRRRKMCPLAATLLANPSKFSPNIYPSSARLQQ